MRSDVYGSHRRRLVRGAALVILGGLAAGCSSDVSRFQDSILTGSSRAPQPAPASQPYPGDVVANVDATHTGSVQQPRRGGILNRAGLVPVPQENVGQGGQQIAAHPQPAQGTYAAPSGAVSGGPALAPVARQQLDGTVTGGTQPLQQAQPVQQAAVQPTQPSAPRASGQGGWSAEGGTNIAVREGDTLFAISRRFNVPEDALRRANGMSASDTLMAGRTLVIPTFAQPGGPATASAPVQQPQPQQEPSQHAVLPQQPQVKDGQAPQASARPATGTSYTVVAGDTLSGISRRTGVSTEELKRANNLSSGLIRIGQTLVIPGSGQASTTQVASAPATTSNVDPIVTSGAAPTGPSQPAASSYTPPVTSARQLDVAALDPDAAAPGATGADRMRWPARGRVIAGFGADVSGRANDGIDISVPEGTSVRAAENGVVIYAGDGLREFGNTVLIRHEDGLVTVYGHNSRINVSRGDNVRRGQEIALSGMSGSAESPRLHFEVRKDSTPVDPMTFLE